MKKKVNRLLDSLRTSFQVQFWQYKKLIFEVYIIVTEKHRSSPKWVPESRLNFRSYAVEKAVNFFFRGFRISKFG